MKFTNDKSHCPNCGNPYLTRRKRSLWMRLIRVTKCYRCDACQCRVLYRAPSNRSE